MREDELMILRTQAAQAKESMAGCPEQCFAARFLRDYGKMFDLFEASEKQIKKMNGRYQKLDEYCKKLERKIEVLKGWQDTVDENNESR